MEDAVGINLELHTDSWDSAWRRLKPERKTPQAPVVARAFAFALQHLDEHLTLIVHGGGKHFTGFDRDGRVARNDNIHQTAECFDAKGKRRYIEQQYALQSARE